MLKNLCRLLLVASSGCLGIDVSGHGSGASGTGATGTTDAGTVDVLCGTPFVPVRPEPSNFGYSAEVICVEMSKFQPPPLGALSVGFVPASLPCSVESRHFDGIGCTVVIACEVPDLVLYTYTDTDGYDLLFVSSTPDGG